MKQFLEFRIESLHDRDTSSLHANRQTDNIAYLKVVLDGFLTQRFRASSVELGKVLERFVPA
jgi:hypothetical protein